MLKKIILRIFYFLLGRGGVIRLSKALLNDALGENNGTMGSNGEIQTLSRVVQSFPREQDHVVIFDVGANVGDWTKALLARINERALASRTTVFCFEPCPATFLKLEQNLENDAKGAKIVPVNIGLGREKGTLNLYINKNCPGTNSLYHRRTQTLGIVFDGFEKVGITTLDDYCLKQNISHINFLKSDTEGHDLAVLKGAQKFLENQAIDFIQFEYGGCWLDSRIYLMDMFDLLMSNGYRLGKILAQGIEFYQGYDQRLENFQLANFLACRPNFAGHFHHIKPWFEKS